MVSNRGAYYRCSRNDLIHCGDRALTVLAGHIAVGHHAYLRRADAVGENTAFFQSAAELDRRQAQAGYVEDDYVRTNARSVQPDARKESHVFSNKARILMIFVNR